MWASVRDALAILLGGNLGEVGFTVVATALTGTSPLNAAPAAAGQPAHRHAAGHGHRPAPPGRHGPEALLHEGPEASLGGALAREIALRAVTTAGGATGAWLVARATGTAAGRARSALAALVGTQLGQTAVAGGTSPVVLRLHRVSAAALVAIVQTPGVSQFFGCTPLGPVGWATALSSASVATGASVAVPWAGTRLGRRLWRPGREQVAAG